MSDTPRCDELNDETIDFRRYGKLWELARALERHNARLREALSELLRSFSNESESAGSIRNAVRQARAALKEDEK